MTTQEWLERFQALAAEKEFELKTSRERAQHMKGLYEQACADLMELVRFVDTRIWADDPIWEEGLKDLLVRIYDTYGSSDE